MAPLPTRKVLEEMKRADLQRICKEYGVKANLKSEALIDLLLETQSPQAVQPSPTRRSVSTRQSSRAGPSRTTSMIIHETEQDEEAIRSPESRDGSYSEPAEPVQPQSMIPQRTRKAKDLQKRLGVGKPIIAGGQGVRRSLTRSTNGSREKLIRASKNLRPREATIEEESESAHEAGPVANNDAEEPADPHDAIVAIPEQASTLNKFIEAAVRPLQEQIRQLRMELQQMQNVNATIAQLFLQVETVAKSQEAIKKDLASLSELFDTVHGLEADFAHLKVMNISDVIQRPTTPKGKAPASVQANLGFGLPSVFRGGIQPGTSPKTPTATIATKQPSNTLGKRQRDLRNNDPPESIDTSAGPLKKRPRIQSEVRSSTRRSSNPLSHHEDDEHSDVLPPLPTSTFTVFADAGDEDTYVDLPSPSEPPPEVFRSSSPSNGGQLHRSGMPTTSSSTAAENQPHHFTFPFNPTSSTPHTMYLPTFPYHDPPPSPSPVSSNVRPTSSHHQDRTDIFKNFGFPSPTRPRYPSTASTGGSNTVDPATLMEQLPVKQRGKEKESYNEPPSTFGLAAAPSDPSKEVTDNDHPSVTKRTMYGTELEGDTRFGDFGVEGVAASFWPFVTYPNQ